MSGTSVASTHLPTAHTSSRDTSSRLETAPQHRPVHTHQMSRVWTQKEVELNHEELAKKECERRKAEAQLESKHNLRHVVL